jgi:hypothetical protein
MFFDTTKYGPVLSLLVDCDRLRPLDSGRPRQQCRSELKQATLEAAFAHAKIADRDMAKCCLAGVWLVHDFLDESHTISQEIDTTSGSFWHGIMHRREGDFSNAKYWFRRAGSHEVLQELGPQVVEVFELNGNRLAVRIALAGRFDPFAMVDACQAALRSGGAAEAFCRQVQQLEWELLFDFCYRRAVAV